MSLSRTANIVIIVLGVGAILYFGKGVLIPFVLAALVWYILKELRNFISGLRISGKNLPVWLQNILAFVAVFFILSFLSRILVDNIKDMTVEFPKYEANFNGIVDQINALLDYDITSIFKSLDFSSMLSGLAGSISGIISSASMVLIYVLFLLLEESSFSYKLKSMYPDPEDYEEATAFVNKVNKSISDYISLKTIVSILTGVLSYFILILIGVDFPVFWATLIFLFNYIPTIGSLIATIFPALIAALQFGDFMPGLYVLVGVGTVQLLIGNVLEPKIMGNSLNISPLVVILSLAVFGALWGITGMILCVPITVILIIIFSNFPATRSIAIWLSDRGIDLQQQEERPAVPKTTEG